MLGSSYYEAYLTKEAQGDKETDIKMETEAPVGAM